MTRSRSSREEGGGKGRLPAPRKLPSQSRSRSLVSALIEACLRILQGEGAEALTMHRLSEVSGVAVGSIYQYLPNMEAIAALAFDHILDEEATVHVAALRERIAGLALDAALREILDNMVRMELRLYRLHREFHLKYHPDLKVGMRTGPYENTRQYVDEAWSAFVTMYLPSLDPLRRDMAPTCWASGCARRSAPRSGMPPSALPSLRSGTACWRWRSVRWSSGRRPEQERRPGDA